MILLEDYKRIFYQISKQILEIKIYLTLISII